MLRTTLLAVAVLGAFAVTPTIASASVYGVPTPPQQPSVGQTSVPTAFTVHDGSGAGVPTTLGLITVVMACDTSGDPTPGAHSSCPVTAAEPGVLRPSATGVGRAGSTCAGATFTITQTDPVTDKYSITPVGGPLTITGDCVVDYTVDVLRKPTQDSQASQPGTQSWMLGFASDGTPENGSCNPGCGSNVSYGFVDAPPPPTQILSGTSIACSPNPVVAGAPTSCTATVSNAGSGTSSAPSGTVAFSNGTSCPLAASGSSSSCSASYTPSGAGTSTITATYGGDNQYQGSSGQTTVTASPRSTGTSVSCSPNPTAVGSATTCTATVADTDVPTASAPTGNVTFSNGVSCPLAGSGSSSSCSVSFAPAGAGPTAITATYGGDASHAGSSGGTSVTATPSAPYPTSADQCKKGGWAHSTTKTGRPFNNQGDCVSYVATGGK